MSVPFVQTPQALLFDTSVSAGAVRLYDIIRVCQWRGRALSADEVAELAGTNRRSLYRFLDELVAGGWATFDKRRGVTDLLERVTLHESRCAEFGTPLGSDSARCDDNGTLGVPNSARRCDKIGTPLEILPAPRAAETPLLDPDRSSGIDHTTTPLPPTTATPPLAEQPRGGGGVSATPIGRSRAAEQPAAEQQPKTDPAVRELLAGAGVRTAWRFASVPLGVAQAAIAQVATAKRADDRGALIANLLNAYTRGEWEPTATTTAAPADDRPRSYSAADPELLCLDGYTRGKALQRLRAADSRRRQLEILNEYQAQAVAV